MLHSPGPIIVDLGNLFHLPYQLPLRWYGFLTGLGFFCVLFIVYLKALQLKKEKSQEAKWQITNTQKQNLIDLLFLCFIGGIVGARLWYIILNKDYFVYNPINALKIWEGGQSIQGGFIGGLLTGLGVYKIRYMQNKLYLLPPIDMTADLVAIGLPIGQAIGRWGNFFNMEAFGKPSILPWSQYIPLDHRPVGYLAYSTFHSVFLYESIYLVIIFFILNYYFNYIYSVQNKKEVIFTQTGILFPIYLILYSFGRFFLEFLRLDSLMIGYFPAAQIICLFMISASIFFLFFMYRNSRQNKKFFSE